MFTTASLEAYDCLGEIVIFARVRQQEDPVGQASAYETFSCQVRGTGETEPREWLKDALIALVETL